MSASNVTLRISGPYHIPIYFISLDPAKFKWTVVDDSGSPKHYQIQLYTDVLV